MNSPGPRGLTPMDEAHPGFVGAAPQLSRYMVHLWSKHGLWREFHLQDAASRFAFLVEWFLPRLSSLGFGPDRIPPYVAEFLNEPVLDTPESHRPLSRLMLAVLLKENHPFNPGTSEGYQEAAFEYVSGLLPGLGLPASFVPSYALDFLNERDTSVPRVLPPLTRFWREVWGRSTDYRKRYDIRMAEGRSAFVAEVLLRHYGHERYRGLFPDYLIDYWVHPVDGAASSSRFAFLVSYAASVAQQQHSQGGTSTASMAEAEEIFTNLFCQTHPRLLRFSKSWDPARPAQPTIESGGRPPTRRALPASWQVNGINLVGYASLQSGVGANLLMSRNALSSAGFKVSTYSDHWDEFVDLPEATQLTSRSTQRPILLCHVNADAVPELLARTGDAAAAAYKIGFFLWELTELPEQHDLGLHLVDEIWTPTEYVREAYAKRFAGPVVNVGKGLCFADPNPALGRVDFGIPESSFSFLTYFDFDSSIERKNPLAVVRAFKAAFPKALQADVSLVVKYCNFQPNHWGNRYGHIEALHEEAAGDARIKILDVYLPEADLMALHRCSDCFVSLHRSEGFGYGPAQALWLGKPTVVTDYSGTKDFCTAETSFPVDYELRYLRPAEFLYDVPGAQWAEVKLESAIAALRQVKDNPVEAKKRAARGAALIRDHYSRENYARRCIERLATLE